MAVLYLLGQVMERKVQVYNIIFAAMALILLLDPRELFRPGFQFSFMAVLSIIYGYNKLSQIPILNSFLNKRLGEKNGLQYFRKWIWIPFLVSLSAVVGTLPVTLYYYGMFPVYAVLANLIVIPIAGLLVFLSIFILLAALISPFFAAGIGQVILTVNHGLQILVGNISELPFASITTVLPSLAQIVVFYLMVILLLNMRNINRSYMYLFPLLILIGFTLGKREGKYLQIAFLDVGQGDAIFIRFPNQKTMLIDAGNSSLRWNHGAKTVLPFLKSTGITELNYLVGSHPHGDHIGGFLHLLQSISVDTLVLSAYKYKSVMFKNILTFAIENDIPIKTVYRGDQLRPDSSCRVYVLHPDSQFVHAETYSGAECNNSSIVLKVQYGENGILLTGDLEIEGEVPTFSYNSFLECEILKIGHHGSSTSSSDHFVQNINPLVTVISVAKKNKFKHPSPKTLKRLRLAGIKIYQTSQEGAIIFNIEPKKITRVAWR
jgi:competence protein ComEC